MGATSHRYAVSTGLLQCATLGILMASAASAQQTPASEAGSAEALERRLDALERRAGEWRTRDSVFHLAGYADAGYADRSGGESGFDLASFNPIIHYQYQDRVLLEAELEISIDADGETELEMEYSTVDVILNDSMVLVAGKFLSPVGYFQQNLHPSWINKLASVPVGFGHDGAALATEIGVQLRGGVALANDRLWTYAVYVGNGPELEAEDGEVMGVAAEGFTRDVDDSKVWGGRVSVMPMATVEVGFSGARGKATITESDAEEFSGDPKRDYTALGADVGWRWGKSLDVRGEYIRQKVGSAGVSIAPDSATWDAWYVQTAYRWPDTPWEFAARYGEFRSPDAAMEQDQVMLGVSYLWSSNAMAKFGYEFNNGLAGEDSNRNRWLLQIAYGL
ncbi:MAG TPA: porin [Steroidobacteraceae bacterium]|nr:porin [Steroidobacteraceae bacterium]